MNVRDLGMEPLTVSEALSVTSGVSAVRKASTLSHAGVLSRQQGGSWNGGRRTSQDLGLGAAMLAGLHVGSPPGLGRSQLHPEPGSAVLLCGPRSSPSTCLSLALGLLLAGWDREGGPSWALPAEAFLTIYTATRPICESPSNSLWRGGCLV